MGLLHLYGESDDTRCGMMRKSSKWNWNLVKADLGRVRRVTHRIRDQHFIYGRPNERNALGIKEVIAHLETVAPPQGERYGADFKKMNKAAAIHHYCRSNEQRAARERFYFHIQPKNRLNTKWRLPSDKNPHHRYGLAYPGDGEFKYLIGGGYQDEWIDMNEYFKAKHPERYSEAPGRMEPISNKAAELQKQFTRARISRPAPRKRFILSKFQNVPKRVDNENQTPLNRSPPFHKFYGIKDMSTRPKLRVVHSKARLHRLRRMPTDRSICWDSKARGPPRSDGNKEDDVSRKQTNKFDGQV